LIYFSQAWQEDLIKPSKSTVLYKAPDFTGFHHIGSHQQMINRLKQANFSPLQPIVP